MPLKVDVTRLKRVPSGRVSRQGGSYTIEYRWRRTLLRMALFAAVIAAFVVVGYLWHR